MAGVLLYRLNQPMTLLMVSNSCDRITCASADVLRKRIMVDYEERIRSLRDDGYMTRHDTRLASKWIARLHHMSNGNDILITADFRANAIMQQTNHILVHYCTYVVDDSMCQP